MHVGTEATLRERLSARQPLFGLRVVTPRLSLAMPTDDELLELLDVIDHGVHDPATMPFLRAWTDEPRAEREQNSLAHWWRLRATFSPHAWTWCGAVRVDGRLVGVQEVIADSFAETRTVKTASWLGQRYQGHGVGKEMRAAILHLAFEGLGAHRAISGYLDGNASSRAVSQSFGYRPTGFAEHVIRGRSVRENILSLDQTSWRAQRRDDITIEGLDACLELFGAGATSSSTGATE